MDQLAEGAVGVAELAGDLHRFLEDRPTRARPVGAWSRAAWWCWRHQALTALLAVVALGSVALAENVPAADAVAVARLKRAGAILLGKTTTPEFGHKPFTEGPLFGRTANAWDHSRTSGGSSGATSASVRNCIGSPDRTARISRSLPGFVVATRMLWDTCPSRVRS